MILKTIKQKEYELLDSGNGEKLERYGQYILRRPDPEALWEKSKIDLELAQKMLKEFPKTKQFARIGLFIAIVLALKELYILLKQ